MEVRQVQCVGLDDPAVRELAALRPSLVLVFADISILDAAGAHRQLRSLFPDAALAGCSTAGEITSNGVSSGTCVITAIRFARTGVRVAETDLPAMEQSAAAGARLGRLLAASDLRAVLLFGKGVSVNGSALIAGLSAAVGAQVPISGGLAGDGGAFVATATVMPSAIAADGAVAVGLYGDAIRVGHGSVGGWRPFGPPRRVTRAAGNILYELDGQPALDLYRRYLGEYARELPASGLLFPFEMLDAEHRSVGLIRTILGVDAASGALVLAGDIDATGYLRLMHASRESLVEGALLAARRAWGGPGNPGLALLVSCVGRKLVMGDGVDEEVEVVSGTLGGNVPLAGFYSYGEIAPFLSGTDCRLHNQTMTVTCLAEV